MVAYLPRSGHCLPGVCLELSLLMAEDLTNPWERGWGANAHGDMVDFQDLKGK